MFLLLWMMTKDSLRLKRVFLLLNNQTSFPICDFHVVSLPYLDLYATVAHPTTSFQLLLN